MEPLTEVERLELEDLFRLPTSTRGYKATGRICDLLYQADQFTLLEPEEPPLWGELFALTMQEDGRVQRL